MNINWKLVLRITGTVLGLAGSLIASASQKDSMNEAIKKEVAKALSEKGN